VVSYFFFPIVHLPVQSVYITTNVVSSNPAHGQVYLIQHYVIKFVNDLWQVGGFLRVLETVSSTNKTDRHDIAKLFLVIQIWLKLDNNRLVGWLVGWLVYGV
jgi:hypothetical protein